MTNYMPIIHGLKDEVIKKCLERAKKEKRTMCPEFGITSKLRGKYL